MSVALRSERIWIYDAADPTGDDIQAATYALAPAPTADLAYWAAYAPQNGRESTVALRRTAIGKAVFTVADAVPITESALVRLVRTGTLYTVTGVRPVPAAREIVFDGETVERGLYNITADVPAHTAANVLLNPATLNVSVGTVRRFTATVTNADSVVLQDRPVVWSSSDRNVVNIDAQGRAEAFSAGTAIVTATAGDAVGSATVTVSA